MVGKSSWCHAAALPVGTNILFVNSDVTSTRLSLRRCRAFAAATFNCSGVNGGISTGGGGGALITPETTVEAVVCWLLAICKTPWIPRKNLKKFFNHITIIQKYTISLLD